MLFRSCFHVFGCISKKFLENIFWCLEKKKENTNPEKHKPQPRKKSSTTNNQNPAKCIKSGKINQNPAKENESTPTGAITARRSTSDAIVRMIALRDLVDHAARRSTSDAIVRTIALCNQIDHARRHGAIVRRAARSTSAIDEIVRCDRSDDRIARQSMSGAIDEIALCDCIARRSTSGDRTARR